MHAQQAFAILEELNDRRRPSAIWNTKRYFTSLHGPSCAAESDESNYLRAESGNDLRIAGCQLYRTVDNILSTAT